MGITAYDYSDIYVRDINHPNYNDSIIQIDDRLTHLIQCLENILYTNPGEVLGDNKFGAGLKKLVYNTTIPTEIIARSVNDQIEIYLPDLINKYTLNVNIYPAGTIADNQYDAALLEFYINGDNILFLI